jgi:putative ABC transport system ATP-binding protein
MSEVSSQPPEGSAALELKDVGKRYPPRPGEEPAAGARPLFERVDLVVPRGDFVAIEGQSGSGKSTLLHLAGGLDRHYQGTVKLLGEDLAQLSDAQLSARRNHSLGFVFQAFNLLPQLSALENVLLPAAFGGAQASDYTSRAKDVLALVGLARKSMARPAQLSGGERQRVAIARALLLRPTLLLCDEPTGNLDARTGAGIIELFRDLHRAGTTLLIVTHEVRVSRAASRVLLLREGRLEHQEVDPLQAEGAFP